MASGLYAKAKETLLSAGINLTTADVRAILIDSGAYTVSLTTHDFLDDVPAGARIGTAVALSTKSVTDGVFDAADISFTGLSSAPSIEAILLYVHTGADATARLIAYIDNFTAIAAGATQVDVSWDNGASKIFAI